MPARPRLLRRCAARGTGGTSWQSTMSSMRCARSTTRAWQPAYKAHGRDASCGGARSRRFVSGAAGETRILCHKDRCAARRRSTISSAAIGPRRGGNCQGESCMTAVDETRQESRAFDADVARLLHLIVHSVYSDKEVFLRELISNAADACEKLRYEAIAQPQLLGDDPVLRITLKIDADKKSLTVEDNGIGMSREEMVQGLGTIAHSGTKAFMERIEAAQGAEGASLIGQFGVGFYSAFMVTDRVEVFSRRAGSEEAWQWSSDGKGTFSVAPAALEAAAQRGTRVVLHLTEEAKAYLERFRLERMVRAQSGHVPVPISIVEKPGEKPFELADGAALWAKPKTEISTAEY